MNEDDTYAYDLVRLMVRIPMPCTVFKRLVRLVFSR